MSALPGAATHYAERGLRIVPLHTVRDGSCSCGRAVCDSPGKHPRVLDWQHAATTDKAQLRAWWGRWPDANTGIATGAESGLIVIDVDGPAGEEALLALQGRHGPLPRGTPVARTGRAEGGRHIYFRHPGGVIPSCAGLAGLKGLDVRGDGGYVVAPPSLHASGARYVWELAPDAYPVADVPEAWIPVLQAGRGQRNGGQGAGVMRERIPDGRRNTELTSLAGTMRRRGMGPDAIDAALQIVNLQRCDPALGADEVRRIAEGVAARYEPRREADGDAISPLRDLPADAGLQTVVDTLRVVADALPPAIDGLTRAALREAMIAEVGRRKVASAPAALVGAALSQAAQSQEEDSAGVGRPGRMTDPTPAPDPQDTGALLDDVETVVGRYLVLPTGAADAVSLWVMHTWTADAADTTPRLRILSPCRECGKTRLVEVLEGLVRRPLRAENVSLPALFRALAAWEPTMLLDEADHLMADREARGEIIGAINAGQRRGGTVLRTAPVGDDWEPREYPVFGAMAIAGIGDLAETVESRSIRIEMARMSRGTRVSRLRVREYKVETAPLRTRLARWSQDHVAALGEARPDLPDWMTDRQQDGWEPLLAIADLAGGTWPARARESARVLCGAVRESTDDAGVMLLADMRDAFGGRDAVPTEELLIHLRALEERPWGTWRRGQSLSPPELAGLLRPYHVRPRVIRIGAATARGYRAADLQDVWARYLPLRSIPLDNPKQRNNGVAAPSDGVTGASPVTDRDSQEMPPNRACDSVTEDGGGPVGAGGISPARGGSSATIPRGDGGDTAAAHEQTQPTATSLAAPLGEDAARIHRWLTARGAWLEKRADELYWGGSGHPGREVEQAIRALPADDQRQLIGLLLGA